MANVRLNDEVIEDLHTIKTLTKEKSLNGVVQLLASTKIKELEKRYKLIEYMDMSLAADNLRASKELSSRGLFCAKVIGINDKIFGYEDSIIKANFDKYLYINFEEYESNESEYTMKVFTPLDIKKSDWRFLIENELDLQNTPNDPW